MLKTYQVKIYTKAYYSKWNDFVANAKNATFLFHRDFMEYHSDRFEDYSLLVFDEKENLKAILPANRVGEVVYSHQGLTYGGLVLNSKSKLSEVIYITESILRFLQDTEIVTLELKQIPTIYNDFPSDEIEYISFITQSKLVKRDTLSVIDLQSSYKIASNRKQEITKAKDLLIKEVHQFEEFWSEILIPNLQQKHQAKPVHSLAEMGYLKSKFPKQIRQFNVYKDNQIIAGTTIFESNTVAHSQYISGLSHFNALGGLDFLHHYLITEVFKGKKYFDFGISNENQGKNINQGLLFWKESFGARTITQNFYSIETKNFTKLNTIFI